MARTSVAAQAPLGSYPATPLTAGIAKLNMAGADQANGNSFACTGRELVVISNTDAAARTVTFTSNTDPQGRKGDITAYSIPSGEVHVFGPFYTTGWRQSDGTVWIDWGTGTLSTTTKVGILTLAPF